MYYTTIVALGLFCISPLLSLPFILWDVYKQHRSGLVLFVLFLSIMAFLTPPVGDLYRHTRDYFNMANYSFEAFRHALKDDFFVQSFSYLLRSLDIEYPYARLIFTIIGFSITFWIFDDMVRGKYSNRQYFVLFLLFFCSSGFFGFVTGVRNVFASKFFLAGFYLLYEKDKKLLGLLSLAVAPCIHFSFLSLVLLVVALRFLKYQIGNKMFVVAGSVLFSLGLVISVYVVQYFFEDHSGYLEGQWGTDYHASTRGMIYYYIGKVWWIPLFAFFMQYRVEKDTWNNVIFAFTLLFLMTCNFATISGRLLISLTGLLVLYYIKNNAKCPYKLEKTIMYSLLFIFLCSVYNFRMFFTNFHVSAYNEIWKPLPVVLQHDFDGGWINGHIRQDGDVKIKYKQ